MILTIVIDMDNAAFDIGRGEESARILRGYCDRIDGSQLFEGNEWALFDVNGNRAGYAKVSGK